MFSDLDITKALTSGEIVLSPYDSTLLQSSSIDVRLDYRFLVPNVDAKIIDPKQEMDSRVVEVDKGDGFLLYPGDFVLASTYETLTLGNSVASRLEGKSSLGRLGLLTHATAGFIDPGFSGTVTLELANLSPKPLRLWPGMKIGQLCFFRLDSLPARAYGEQELGSHYQGQSGPTASRSWDGFRVDDIYDEAWG